MKTDSRGRKMIFNPNFREGYMEALREKHARWCELNPDVSREKRSKAYMNLAEALKSKFPTAKETA